MSQKFTIDKNTGNFCIPYVITSPSIDPPSGRLSLYNNNVQETTKISVNKTNFDKQSITPYLTGSNAGTLTISSKNFPTSYAIFPYTIVEEETNYVNFISSGSSAFSDLTPFTRGETVCIVLDYNDRPNIAGHLHTLILY